MVAEASTETGVELRSRFFSLIDSLSALRVLADADVRHRSEDALALEALGIFTEHEPVDHCGFWLNRDGQSELVGVRDWRNQAVSLDDEEIAGIRSEVEQVIATSRSVVSSTAPRISVPVLARRELVGAVSVRYPKAVPNQAFRESVVTLFCGFLAHILDINRLLLSMEEAVATRTRQLESALREAQHLKLRYEELSHIDELTGLHNRRFFFPESNAALARATRYGHPFSLMLVDIDHFKSVNDTHGHSTGDRVLVDVAQALRTVVRDGDIVARFGGEEFVVALPNTDSEGGRRLAERILDAIRALRWDSDEGTATATASIGLATLGGRESNDRGALLDTLLREADRAMYVAKRDGRDCVRVDSDLG